MLNIILAAVLLLQWTPTAWGVADLAEPLIAPNPIKRGIGYYA